MSVPSLLLMWLFGLRSPDRKRLNKVVSWGRWATMAAIVGQGSHTIYLIYLDNGWFRWSNGLTLLLLLWFALYLTNSHTARDCFKVVEHED
ncbi:hypothetical protein VCHA34P131_50071 [Vibrio chagasii]|nr:hypothetical protein VCHA34P120_150005 [Vibrio chagasii]CAH6958452.1 hypothetical protein VCHA34P131_50071 [Vibrio chagasii]